MGRQLELFATKEDIRELILYLRSYMVDLVVVNSRLIPVEYESLNKTRSRMFLTSARLYGEICANNLSLYTTSVEIAYATSVLDSNQYRISSQRIYINCEKDRVASEEVNMYVNELLNLYNAAIKYIKINSKNKYGKRSFYIYSLPEADKIVREGMEKLICTGNASSVSLDWRLGNFREYYK